MSYENPYVSPAAYPPLEAQLVDEPSRVWRTRSSLVVSRQNAHLPDRCVKCNSPVEGWRLRRRMYWHPGWVYLTILAGIPVYVILALVLRKNADVRIGICRRHRKRRRWIIALGWLGTIVTAAGFLYGVSRIGMIRDAGLIAVVSFFAFVLVAIAALVLARTVYPTKMDDHFVWIKGVHRTFLAELPDWPGW